jgi:Ca-activated chloride channel family protein
MKLRNAVILTSLAMALTSAGALALPMKAVDPTSPATLPGASAASPTGPTSPTARDLSRFVDGKTLAVEARLGHGTLAKDGTGETYLLATISGADAPGQAAPLNLALVIDRSGSMKGERIARALDAAVGIVERLREGDTVTVVSFDTMSQVVVPPTEIHASARSGIESRIRSIRLGGDTCISCGLEAGMTALRSASVPADHVERMILLSDGATNHGVTDMPGLRAMAGHMRDRGCSISTIGVDVDFDEKVMSALASESNGRHYFVNDASGLPAVFAQELDSLLATVAHDSEMAIELAPGVVVDQVFDRTFRREVDTNGVRIYVPLGTFAAKQQKTLLLKLRVPVGQEGNRPVAAMHLVYKDMLTHGAGHANGELALAVVGQDAAQKDIDPFVGTRLERSRTAQTLTEANLLFEEGRVDEARDKLASQQGALRIAAGRTRSTASAGGDEKAADDLEQDFDKQIAAVSRAEANFGPAATATAGLGTLGHGAGGGAPVAGVAAAPAAAKPSPDVRAGKAQVRENQQNAFDMAF